MTDASSPSRPSGVHGSPRTDRPVSCPACGSLNIQTKNHAKRLGGALGTCAGVISAFNGAATGAVTGATIAFRFTPPATPLTSVTAAVLGALAGGVMGCAAGAGLGQVIDDTVLNNHQCLRCDHSFQAP